MSKSILIVEHDPGVVEPIETSVEDIGFAFQHVCDGEDSFDRARGGKHAHEPKPLLTLRGIGYRFATAQELETP